MRTALGRPERTPNGDFGKITTSEPSPDVPHPSRTTTTPAVTRSWSPCFTAAVYSRKNRTRCAHRHWANPGSYINLEHDTEGLSGDHGPRGSHQRHRVTGNPCTNLDLASCSVFYNHWRQRSLVSEGVPVNLGCNFSASAGGGLDSTNSNGASGVKLCGWQL